VKKPELMEMPVLDEPQQKNVDRADIMPSSGFILEVDGRMKKQFDSESGARAEALELKTRFPMLQVNVYDAVGKTRTPVLTATDDKD